MQIEDLVRPFGEKYQYVYDFVCTGGKYVRPLLFLESSLLWGSKIDEKMQDIAIAIELVHAFLLIHDDIIDNDELRRGKPTLLAYFSKGGNHVQGRAVAIVIGDLLFNEAILLLNRSAPVHLREPAIALVLNAIKGTALGEILETEHQQVPTLDDIVRFYKSKTAEYSVYMPIALASLLAGRLHAQQTSLKELSDHLGLAYQIYDDVVEVQGEKQRFTDASRCGDISRLKMTPILLDVIANAPEDMKKIILEKFGKGEELERGEEQEVLTFIREHDILHFSKERIHKALLGVKTSISALGLSESAILSMLIATYEGC